MFVSASISTSGQVEKETIHCMYSNKSELFRSNFKRVIIQSLLIFYSELDFV